jgi:hypothetical protein
MFYFVLAVESSQSATIHSMEAILPAASISPDHLEDLLPPEVDSEFPVEIQITPSVERPNLNTNTNTNTNTGDQRPRTSSAIVRSYSSSSFESPDENSDPDSDWDDIDSNYTKADDDDETVVTEL